MEDPSGPIRPLGWHRVSQKFKFFVAYALLLLTFLIVMASCSSDKPSDEQIDPPEDVPRRDVKAPDFNADSAYQFIAEQVAFGPRVPGTQGHADCAEYLKAKLKAYGAADVREQNATVTAHDGKSFNLRNILATINPQFKKKIMLCAHWDTRPVADQSDTAVDQPILGANDGGSGVAVILEIARQMAAEQPAVGVEIVLFDIEDYGQTGIDGSYCLGSQHWAKNHNKDVYFAHYGILLDMVGGKNALFPKEGNSMDYAASRVKRVWETAERLGYGNYFKNKTVHGIIDDHYYINRQADIPTLDIIHYRPMSFGQGRYIGEFGSFWHTHADNLSIIDRNTLKAVGQTVLTVLYEEVGQGTVN